MIQVIWEYKVKTDQIEKFEEIYNKDGEWVRFFKKSRAYKKTELIVKDKENSIYMTIDTWKTLEQYELFIKTHQKEYKRLDNSCRKLTIEENEIGIFSEK